MTNYNNQDLRDRAAASNQNVSNQTRLSNQADLADGMVQRPTAHNQTAYQDGYWQGRYSERRDNVDRRAAEDEGTASGIIFGLLLASLVGLGLGTYFFLNEQNRTPRVTPNVTAPAPSPSQQPEVRQERIIERVVPVPQQAPDAPDVNVTIPNPAPESRVTQPAPEAAPGATQNAVPTQPATGQ
ncbi:MAG: hypothetical protein IGS48_15025 [Oscillatoriales cyanobacterium C42_A2020_001]|nr:hypothetical protein [Leptolyngbyaceae cyanobacterium C42_A2020_001]